MGSRREYRDRIGDVGFWYPYVAAVVARHRLPPGPVEAGFIGTYPTFLVGGVVVKLFGHSGFWRDDHAAELAAQQLLGEHPDIPAPPLLEHGRLYDRHDSWPSCVSYRPSRRG